MMTSMQYSKRPWQLIVGSLFAITGGVIIVLSLAIGLFDLTPTASDYFSSNSKLARDAAGVDITVQSEFEGVNAVLAEVNAANLDTAALGNELLPDLESLQATPRWKEPLAFLGIASFMTGIALAFSSIPNLLRQRGQAMREAFRHMENQATA